jgi:hypothetical protein
MLVNWKFSITQNSGTGLKNQKKIFRSMDQNYIRLDMIISQDKNISDQREEPVVK